VAVERSVLASLRAFHFLHSIHTVRFGGRFDAMRTALDPENSESEQDDGAENAVPKTRAKRKVHRNHAITAQDNTDSNSSACMRQSPNSLERSHEHHANPCLLEECLLS
jgi:hypothetical protein